MVEGARYQVHLLESLKHRQNLSSCDKNNILKNCGEKKQFDQQNLAYWSAAEVVYAVSEF